MATLLSLTLGSAVAALAGPIGVPPASGSAALSSERTITTPSGKRPNIIVVLMDDMRADELRFMPATRDFVRKRGLAFTNGFSPYPLCCPARASILTGKYAHNHGVLHHQDPYGFGSFNDSVTMATRLRTAGYSTGFVGKYLNRYGIQKSRVTGRSSVHYKPAGWTDWKAGLDDGWGGSGGTYSYFNFTQNVNGKVVRNEGVYSSRVIANQGAGLVRKYHGVNKPFFLMINPVAPHHGGPGETGDPGTIYTSNGLKVRYETPARPNWVKGRFDAALPHALGVRSDGGAAEKDVADKPANIRRWPEATARENRAMRNVERQRAESLYVWDQQFRKIIYALKDTGELADTLIVFTSDNGYYNGEHRQRQGKVKAHDPVIRVPLLVAGPGVAKGTRYSPFTLVDLTTTLLEVARAERLPGMDGTSRVPELVGPDRAWTLPVVTEGRLSGIRRVMTGFPAALHTSGLRVGRYQLIMYANGEGELYDLWHDPNQLHSLYSNAAARPLRDKLVALWKQYRACAGAACRVPLPADLQASVTYLAQQEQRRQTAYQAYYR